MIVTRLSTTAIFLLVALRLATGWHFFSEGFKKLDSGFSSAGFLHSAKGPLAPAFRGLVTGPHGSFKILGAAAEADTTPSDSPPYETLVENVESSWHAGLERLGRLGIDEECAARAEELIDQKLTELTHYLTTERAAIEELQHDMWRLEKLRANGDEAPFQREQIEDKEKEIWRTLQPWGQAVSQIDQELSDDLVELAANYEVAPNPNRIRSAMAERSLLSYINFGVKVVLIGSGVGLFLGLFTPLAATAAALFLLSVIATQPPWVAGTDTTYFFYQLVEVLALLFIAAAGAGRWAGLDGVYYRLCRMNCAEASPPGSEPAASEVA